MPLVELSLRVVHLVACFLRQALAAALIKFEGTLLFVLLHGTILK